MWTIFKTIFHVVCWVGLFSVCREELELLVLGVSRRFPSVSRTAERDRKNKRRAMAFIAECLVGYVVVALLLHGYSHAFYDARMTLRAQRTEARSRPPPYGCTSFGTTWDQLTWMQALRASVTESDLPCQEWIKLVTMPIDPSHWTVASDYTCRLFLRPLIQIAGAVGSCLQSVTDPLSVSLKFYALLVLPGLLLVAIPVICFITPWLSLSNKCAGIVSQRLQPATRLTIEEDDEGFETNKTYVYRALEDA